MVRNLPIAFQGIPSGMVQLDNSLRINRLREQRADGTSSVSCNTTAACKAFRKSQVGEFCAKARSSRHPWWHRLPNQI